MLICQFNYICQNLDLFKTVDKTNFHQLTYRAEQKQNKTHNNSEQCEQIMADQKTNIILFFPFCQPATKSNTSWL